MRRFSVLLLFSIALHALLLSMVPLFRFPPYIQNDPIEVEYKKVLLPHEAPPQDAPPPTPLEPPQRISLSGDRLPMLAARQVDLPTIDGTQPFDEEIPLQSIMSKLEFHDPLTTPDQTNRRRRQDFTPSAQLSYLDKHIEALYQAERTATSNEPTVQRPSAEASHAVQIRGELARRRIVSLPDSAAITAPYRAIAEVQIVAAPNGVVSRALIHRSTGDPMLDLKATAFARAIRFDVIAVDGEQSGVLVVEFGVKRE